ncbi:MAG TPA: TIGR03085 family metal-binding protein [Streptosporangiaceae bacterium]|jgi:uncharacterized protein (TIGR03085 family)
MTYARDERLALCELLDKTGPRAPTLCTGWTTHDLAAHLVLRERRPDAGLGILGGPLAGYTRRTQRRLAERTPYAKLVESIRNGPPLLSFFGIPGVDERGNVVEYFIHHEDVRRAQPDWQPRQLSAGMSDLLWQRLRMARLILRRSPVGVEFARDDHVAAGGPDGTRVRITAKARTPVVTVAGPPAELMLWAGGRTGAARVAMVGAQPDVQALREARWQM